MVCKSIEGIRSRERGRCPLSGSNICFPISLYSWLQWKLILTSSCRIYTYVIRYLFLPYLTSSCRIFCFKIFEEIYFQNFWPKDWFDWVGMVLVDLRGQKWYLDCLTTKFWSLASFPAKVKVGFNRTVAHSTHHRRFDGTQCLSFPITVNNRPLQGIDFRP